MEHKQFGFQMSQIAIRIGLIALWSLNAQASQKDLVNEAVQKFTTFLKKHQAPLDRNLLTFHYSDASDSNRTQGSLKAIRIRVKKHTQAFLTAATSSEPEIAGPGYYLALDPLATRFDYGGEKPELTVATLLAGTVLVDGSYALSEAEKNDFDRLADELNCYGMGGYGSATLGVLIGKFRNGNEINVCAKIVINAMKKAKANAVLYSYHATNLSGCRYRYQAINVVDGGTLKIEAYFSDIEAFATTPEQPSLIARLYRQTVIDDFSLARLADSDSIRPPKQLTIETLAAEKDYQSWKNANLYSCGTRWALEAPVSEQTFEVKPGPSETQRLLREMLVAYRQKTGGRAIDLQSIKAVNELSFAAARALKPDLELKSWADAKSAYRSYAFDYHDGKSEIRLPDALQFLGEQAPWFFMQALDAGKLQAEVASTGDLNAHRLAEHLVGKGFGPVSAQMLATIVLIDDGATPAGVSDSDYRATLQKCLDTYRDPLQSPEAIRAGPCGPSLDE